VNETATSSLGLSVAGILPTARPFTTQKSSPCRIRLQAKRASKRIGDAPPIVKAIVKAVRADVGRRWTLEDLGREINRSPSHLNAVFRRATGLTVREYTLYLRMTKAAREVRGGTKIQAVALLAGFRSRKNFYRQFKAWFGCNPKDFRGSRRSRSEF
jgi:AraC-like DNA-binding protein